MDSQNYRWESQLGLPAEPSQKRALKEALESFPLLELTFGVAQSTLLSRRLLWRRHGSSTISRAVVSDSPPRGGSVPIPEAGVFPSQRWGCPLPELHPSPWGSSATSARAPFPAQQRNTEHKHGQSPLCPPPLPGSRGRASGISESWSPSQRLPSIPVQGGVCFSALPLRRKKVTRPLLLMTL